MVLAVVVAAVVPVVDGNGDSEDDNFDAQTDDDDDVADDGTDVVS